jgi:hypothetical protein
MIRAATETVAVLRFAINVLPGSGLDDNTCDAPAIKNGCKP